MTAAFTRIKPLAILMITIAALQTSCSKQPDQTANTAANATSSQPLLIGYSDWPGWVAWQVAIDKGWLSAAGVDVKFEWFDYAASLDAFAAGRLDAVLATNGDNLVNSANGSRGIMVLMTDYSNGNDMIIAQPNVTNLNDLKGKTVAVEHGLVEHLLLSNALKKASLSINDVKLQNAPTNEMPQMLASGHVAAVGAWQPIAGQTLKAVSGAKPLYTSADEPGLIYDVLAVTPTSLGQRRADWVKVVKVWDQVVSYINDPNTQADALNIMAARAGVTAAEYADFLGGTRLLSLAENQAAMDKNDSLQSLYGSSYFVNQFNVENQIYPQPVDVDSLIDAKLVFGQ
ncbi:MAG: ABC transporter substrate-binding protein [Pseudomonadota bacterium]|nr:ABC transporter substrate-binding protein [Pseudomonadota bacterium]